jgi:RHS repeat-associated protein
MGNDLRLQPGYIECSFDAWGKRTFVTKDPSLVFDRGFTGHEHLDEFGLINMNGRMYDPVVGRFLSPDPYVQAPGFSQSFNRYSYALNNPLKYTDPTGEKWKWWQWGIADILTAGAASTTAAAVVTTAAAKAFNSYHFGLLGGDGFDGAADRAKNAWKISMGLLQTDSDKKPFHQAWQVFSRFTWQQPITAVGYEFANMYNNWTRLDNVEYFHGATVLISGSMRSAISLGGYIVMNPGYGGINYDNTTLLHEYGHFMQTRQWGGMPTLASSIFSGLSAGPDWRSNSEHKNIWTEKDANARSLSYFNDRLNNTQIWNFTSGHPVEYNDNYLFRNWFLFLLSIPIDINDSE